MTWNRLELTENRDGQQNQRVQTEDGRENTQNPLCTTVDDGERMQNQVTMPEDNRGGTKGQLGDGQDMNLCQTLLTPDRRKVIDNGATTTQNRGEVTGDSRPGSNHSKLRREHRWDESSTVDPRP